MYRAAKTNEHHDGGEAVIAEPVSAGLAAQRFAPILPDQRPGFRFERFGEQERRARP